MRSGIPVSGSIWIDGRAVTVASAKRRDAFPTRCLGQRAFLCSRLACRLRYHGASLAAPSTHERHRMAVTAVVEEPTVPAKGRGRLLQVLGIAFGVAVIIGNTIGSGILRTPGSVASLLPSPAAFILAWIAGGAYALLGVVSLAELGVVIPRSGGQYVFARRAFGPYAGFVIGASDWISSTASLAAAAILIGEYLAALFPALVRFTVPVAITVVAVFTVLQWRGVRWGDSVQQATTLLKALAYVALIVACFTLVPVAAPAVSAAAAAAPAAVGIAAVVLAMQAVIFTYDGWNGMLYFSGEIRDPGRQIPRAMFSGVMAIIAIYLLVNIGFVHVRRMRGRSSAVRRARRHDHSLDAHRRAVQRRQRVRPLLFAHPVRHEQ